MANSQVNGARRRYTSFVDYLITKCKSGPTPFGDSALVSGLNNMCQTLASSQVLQDGLYKASASFRNAAAEAIKEIAGAIEFKTTVLIAGQSVDFTGKLTFQSSAAGADMIDITATASAFQLNKYLSASELELTVSVDTDGNIQKAQIGGTAILKTTDGDHNDGSGTFVIDLDDKQFALHATIQTKSIAFSDAFSLNAGTLKIYLTDEEVKSLEIDADADVNYASGETINIAIEAKYSRFTESFEVGGKSDAVVSSLGGLDVLSIGKLLFTGQFNKFGLREATIEGSLCLGSNSDCHEMVQSSNNLVAHLKLEYNGGSWLFVAQLNDLDVKRAIAIVSSQAASNLPDVLNLHLSRAAIAISGNDTDVDLLRNIDVGNKRATMMHIQAGLTIAASAEFTDKKQTVFVFRLPFAGHEVGVVEKPASFMVTLRDPSSTEDFTGGDSALKFGMFKHAENVASQIFYSMKFNKAMPIALAACRKAGVNVPQPAGLVGKGIQMMGHVMDKLPDIYYTFIEHLNDEGDKHFGIQGRTDTGEFGVTVLVSDVNGEKSVLAAVSMSTAFFNGLLSEAMGGSNPLANFAVFSNMAVAVQASSADIALPGDVTLPAPFKNKKSVKKGFCLSGEIGTPTQPCGSDPVCALVSKVLKGDIKAGMEGCFSPAEVSFALYLKSIKLTKSFKIKETALTFSVKPAIVGIAGTMDIEVTIQGSPLPYLFKGKAEIKQSAVATMLGFQGGANGLFSGVFGIDKLNMYNLVLGAEIGVNIQTGVPFPSSALIGGGICFGSKEKCARAVGGTADGVIAGSLNLGFSVAGDAYFYAAMGGSLTTQQVASTFSDSIQLPVWAASIGIFGYTDLSAPYMSFATLPVTIDVLDPPLHIKQGFVLQGRLPMLDNMFAFHISATSSGISVLLDASKAISLGGGAIVIAKERGATEGPSGGLSIAPGTFSGHLNGYAHVEGLGSGSITIELAGSSYSGIMKDVSVFGSSLAFDLAFEFDFKDPTKIHLHASLGNPDGIGQGLAKKIKGAVRDLNPVIDKLQKIADKLTSDRGLCEKATKAYEVTQKQCDELKSKEKQTTTKKEKKKVKRERKSKCKSAKARKLTKKSACLGKKATKSINKRLNSIANAVKKGLAEVNELLEPWQLTGASFEMSAIQSTLNLEATLSNGHTERKISLSTTLTDATNAMAIAEQLWKDVFSDKFVRVKRELLGLVGNEELIQVANEV